MERLHITVRPQDLKAIAAIKKREGIDSTAGVIRWALAKALKEAK